MSYFNHTGWVAVYDHEAEAPRKTRRTENVHSWDGAGTAMVVDRKSGSLVRAAELPAFMHLEETPRIVAAVPAQPGWTLRIWDGDSDDSASSVAPIAAWLVTDVGRVVPVAGDDIASLEPVYRQRTQIQGPTGNS